MIELADVAVCVEPVANESPRLRKGTILAGAAAVAALLLVIAYQPFGPVSKGLVGLVSLIALWKIWLRADEIQFGLPSR
jgi:hypothetical protein